MLLNTNDLVECKFIQTNLKNTNSNIFVFMKFNSTLNPPHFSHIASHFVDITHQFIRKKKYFILNIK